MSTTLRLLSPAKLNLFLHITGRRADGYHLLQTVFQLLDHGDLLELRATRDPAIVLRGDCGGVEPADNLIVRAARLLREVGGSSAGAEITIDKRLPLGGGLGGGSSNAATTLLALNHLWGLDLPLSELAALGLRLGADVPVFVQGRSAWAGGVGEKLTPIPIPPAWYVVLTPPVAVATAEIFAHPQLTRGTPERTIPAFPILGARNDCEPVASLLYPEIREALTWLGRFAEARMTGTGASVFAAFTEREEAASVLARSPDKLRGFLAKGVSLSPVHRDLGVGG